MTRWSKDETKFTVSINYDEKKGSVIRIPKPILAKLGKPKMITFVIEQGEIKIASS